MARYVAIGESSYQTNVDLPCRVRDDTSRPFATAVTPFGTVMRKTYVALSLGWSFDGNQVDAAFGSAPTKLPSSVCRNPYGEPKTIGEPTIVSGTPP